MYAMAYSVKYYILVDWKVCLALYGYISDFMNFYHANHSCTCATIWLTALCCHGVATALKCLLNYVHLTYVVYIATGGVVA